MSGPMSTSPAGAQPMDQNLVDSLLDFSDYDNTYHSPSLSPANKTPFARPVKTEVTTPSLLATNQGLSGPSHQYDLYKQQTGIVPGALASTLEINNNSQVQGYNSFNAMEYLGMNNEDVFDFNSGSSQGQMASPDLDMEFESEQLFFDTINPNSMGGQEPSSLPSPPVLSNQRIWPGMHQQAALAKAQAQQRQQQQLIQQQRQQQQQKPAQGRPKSAMPSDPLVEQKITQLLNSMRAKPSGPADPNMPVMNAPRPKKDEEDMDEDERLLASEEGKKLTSKERRQLRNKVSARAFRSRRKEYITQLEAEIAGKVNENGDLRAHNRALVEENKRLSDLTRMLLSSPSFSDFLDRLSTNPQVIPQQQAQPQQQEQARQVPKDVNPYGAQQQQIGMAMIPEQSMDFSLMGLEGNASEGFTYQPQVYAVLETPEVTIDFSVLSGKTSNFVGEQFDSEDEKVEMPIIERPAPVQEAEPVSIAPVVVDEEFENDPAFALYHAEPVAPTKTEREVVEFVTEGLNNVAIFGGIVPEKAFARFELVDAAEDEATAVNAMARVQSISAGLEDVLARLEMLTADV
ncbi:hypothetical protein GQ53DRAFT_435530 [Thozetella sp. PMI_491]|nr:hypothetical protein GQ53DRAFT_435530 [Thozetella sp. PMI_491]